jgi:hypothetical protein
MIPYILEEGDEKHINKNKSSTKQQQANWYILEPPPTIGVLVYIGTNACFGIYWNHEWAGIGIYWRNQLMYCANAVLYHFRTTDDSNVLLFVPMGSFDCWNLLHGRVAPIVSNDWWFEHLFSYVSISYILEPTLELIVPTACFLQRIKCFTCNVITAT